MQKQEQNAASPQVTVCIVNFNSSPFLKATLLNLRRLTRTSYYVHVMDNGSCPQDLAQLKQLEKDYRTELHVQYRQSPYNGKLASFAHGEALDLLLKEIKSPYALVLDADCVPLLPAWDEILIPSLKDPVAIIGAVPPQETIRRKTDFPLPFFALIDMKKYSKLGISCMPGKIEDGEDTCWQWREKFLQAGYQGLVFKSQNTRFVKSGSFAKFTGVEEYYWNHALVASHFGRGSTQGEGKFLKKMQIPLLSKWIRKSWGIYERNGWIRHCENLGLKASLHKNGKALAETQAPDISRPTP